MLDSRRPIGDALPLVVHDLDGFPSYHPASFEAVRAVVPTQVLHPLRLPDGRALLAFVVTRKRTVTVGSGVQRRPALLR